MADVFQAHLHLPMDSDSYSPITLHNQRIHRGRERLCHLHAIPVAAGVLNYDHSGCIRLSTGCRTYFEGSTCVELGLYNMEQKYRTLHAISSLDTRDPPALTAELVCTGQVDTYARLPQH